MTDAAAGTPVPPRAAPARRWGPVVVVLALVLAGTGLATALARGGAAETTGFQVVDQDGDRVVFGRELAVGETIRLAHTHSVTGGEVAEVFSVYGPRTLALEELAFDEFGPNLPAGPEHVGDHATFVRDGDVYRVLHHGHPIGTVPLLVGSESVDHVVSFEDGERLRLLDVADRGSRVELRVGEAP